MVEPGDLLIAELKRDRGIRQWRNGHDTEFK
jgi:hypothetical protein